MLPRLFFLLTCCSLCLPTFLIEAIAADKEKKPITVQQTVDQIDTVLEKRCEQEGVKPMPLASDSEFLRRASLDITGMIPTVLEAREFLDSRPPFNRPNKRAVLIDRLLASPDHAQHLANLWKKAMLPTDVNARRLGGIDGLHTWLRERFLNNAPYDETVTAILQGVGAPNRTSPALYYTALELKPERLAASTARIFLGVQIGCAQCHDHPFDRWKREEFWSLAAFFAQLERPIGRNSRATLVTDTSAGELKLPDSDRVLPPRFLAGDVSPDVAGINRRARLARWLTSPDNPYFARATVNRIWALMFGRGLVDPVDDLGEHNSPSHPELLDELSHYFVQTDFNVRQLIRVLASTRAYQRSSQINSPADDRPELFARMAIKSLSAEQLYDCLNDAMRRRNDDPAMQQGLVPGGNERDRFLARFPSSEESTVEFQAGIPQALTMMNGAVVSNATQVASSDLLSALDAPFFSDEERLDTLFLSTLSRKPHGPERAKLLQYINKGESPADRNKALGDVLWALLNSAEFMFNH